MKGITIRYFLGLLVCTLAAVLLPSGRAHAGHWQIDDWWGDPPIDPGSYEDFYESTSHHVKQVDFGDLGIAHALACIGESDCTVGAECEVTVHAYLTGSNGYSDSFDLQASYGNFNSVQYVWHPDNGESSPGIALSWALYGHGRAKTVNYQSASADSPGASAYLSVQASASGGGSSPGDYYGESTGADAYVAGVRTANGSTYTYGEAYGDERGDYTQPDVENNPWYFTIAEARWDLDVGGYYLSSEGLSDLWAAGGGGCGSEVYVSISTTTGKTATADGTVFSEAYISYSSMASNPP